MFEPLNVSDKSTMPLILLFLLGCFDDWYTPYVEPTTIGPVVITHRRTKHLLFHPKISFKHRRQTIDWTHGKKKHCISNNSNTGLPYEHMMPLILSVEIDRIQVDGTTLLVDNFTIAPSRSKYPSKNYRSSLWKI